MPGDLLNFTAKSGAKSSIGTSAVQMMTADFQTRAGVVIKAASGNAGTVYVGFSSTVTANSSDATDGVPLAASESVNFEIDEPNKIYLIASQAGQKVFWAAV